MGCPTRRLPSRLGVSRPTVGKWRSRFVERRLEGLVDEDRPGAPRKITDEQVEAGGGGHPGIDPEGRDALVADVDGQALRTVEVHRGPHLEGVPAQAAPVGDVQAESSDPLFIEKVRDVVGLYLDPPERAVVLCVDEKSQVQALDRSPRCCR